MKRTTYQVPELRDENDNIIQEGTFGKKTPLANAEGTGWIDYVANDLEALRSALLGQTLMFATASEFPTAGDESKIYAAQDTGKAYQWNGTAYTELDTQAIDISVIHAKEYAEAAKASESASEASALAASASEQAAKSSETAAATSAGNASTSEANAKASETAAGESAAGAAGSASDAAVSAGQAAASESNAKTSEANAGQSESAAATSAVEAATSASASASSASAAKASETAAKTYMDNAKNYSENVNVFLPNVSSAGVLSWTNKAGLDNPTSVNIKGAKGDTGAAATIRIGSVTTGAAGSNASVTNSGTTSDVVLNFTLPRGKDGTGGGGGTVTVDDELSDTSTNPVQNKVVTMNLDALASGIGAVSNKIPSLADYAKKTSANAWKLQQTFTKVEIASEYYASSLVRGTSDTPTRSIMYYIATGAFTLNLHTIAVSLGASNSTVFTAYIESSADYPLSITGAGTLKYIGAASDVAITSAGLLLNILLTKYTNGSVISIVQASKLS